MDESGRVLSISERIIQAISIKTVFTLDIFGLVIPVSDTVIMTWIIMAIIAIGTLAATRALKMIPGRGQSLVEWFVDFIYGFVGETMGHHGKAYVPFIGTIGVFLLVANLLPVLTPVGGFGFEPPFIIRPVARDVNITAALAIIVIMTSIVSSLRRKGFFGWLKAFLKPSPFMLPFTILECFIKPTSLALRLFGNMLGAFIIMQLLEMVLPVGLPALAGLYFDLFDGILQAVVFTYLSTIFIGEALE